MKVTVITPCSRPEHVQRIKEVFISQTYSDKEMIVLMDIPGYTKDTDVDNCIWQWGTGKKLSIAAKRNECCHYAKGEIIIHMDDDDWFAPDWITRTVQHMQATDADTTGLDKAWFYRPHTRLWQYIWNGKMKYCIGGTLAYKRTIWEKNHFRETASGFGEDTVFMRGAGRIIPHDYTDGFVAMIHGKNSTSHNGVKTNPRFHPAHPGIAHKILGSDYDKYPVAGGLPGNFTHEPLTFK